MLLGLIICLIMGTAGSGPSGQESGIPDLKNYNPVVSKELEFRIDDFTTAIVGRVVVYQNTNDPNDFLRVYYRQLAIISERAQQKNGLETGGREGDLSNFTYHNQEQSDVLARVQQTSDAFAYVQWRTKNDPRSDQDILDGVLNSWLLEPNGNWTFASGYNLVTIPFSEQSKNNPKKRIIVGIEFELAGAVHIVRVDQDEIVAQVKAKEKNNDKK